MFSAVLVAEAALGVALEAAEDPGVEVEANLEASQGASPRAEANPETSLSAGLVPDHQIKADLDQSPWIDSVICNVNHF